MKYLKKYKLFESFDMEEARTEVRELLANLTDDGYDITINSYNPGTESILIVTIQTIDREVVKSVYRNQAPSYIQKPFKWIDIRHELQRMNDYLKDRFILQKVHLQTVIFDGKGYVDRHATFDWAIPVVGTNNLTVRKVELRFSSVE